MPNQRLTWPSGLRTLDGVGWAKLIVLVGWGLVTNQAHAESPGGDDGVAIVTATPPEQVAFVKDVRREIEDAERELSKMLEQQRKKEDANAVECLVTRLTSVQALLRVTGGAQSSLVSAIAVGAEERAVHELRKVTVAMTKTRALVGEAHRCAAGQQFEVGSTTTDVSQDLTSSDAFVVPEITDLDTNVDPPQVSPFL